nr:MAG TPA: hypothetical protein [Caudoviricetes sp.]
MFSSKNSETPFLPSRIFWAVTFRSHKHSFFAVLSCS